jgi:DNA mismatch repair ATPase MutL
LVYLCEQPADVLKDKPTLHLGEHHLLHGKFANLPKPYAVIRRVIGVPQDVVSNGGKTVDGDIEDEESEDSDMEDIKSSIRTPLKRNKGRQKDKNGEEEEDEAPLFQDNVEAPRQVPFPKTPDGRSSSPFFPSSAPRDFSSELDMSSPGRRIDEDEDDEEPDDDQGEEELEARRRKVEEERKRVEAKRKRKESRAKEGRARTRHYEVVGVVRRKVVFALRLVCSSLILLFR